MDLEKTKLININKFKKYLIFPTNSTENRIKKEINNWLSLFRSIYAFLILISFIILILYKTRRCIVSIGLNIINYFTKDLKYYKEITFNFCDNFRNIYNKEIENQLLLFNISLNDKKFDIFIFKNSDDISYNNIQINTTKEKEIILDMLYAVKYY